jgi:hypothetical protein
MQTSGVPARIGSAVLGGTETFSEAESDGAARRHYVLAIASSSRSIAGMRSARLTSTPPAARPLSGRAHRTACARTRAAVPARWPVRDWADSPSPLDSVSRPLLAVAAVLGGGHGFPVRGPFPHEIGTRRPSRTALGCSSCGSGALPQHLRRRPAARLVRPGSPIGQPELAAAPDPATDPRLPAIGLIRQPAFHYS